MNSEREVRFADATQASNQGITFSESEIARFWNTLKMPVIITAAILIIAHRSFGVSEFWRDAVLIGIMFAVLAVRAYHEYDAYRPAIIMVSVMAGALIGIVAAVLRFVEHASVYMVFSLLSEPVIIMTAGGIIAWIASILLAKFGTLHSVRILPSFLRGHQKS